LYAEIPGVRDDSIYWQEKKYEFNQAEGLHPDFQWLRTPEPERIFSIQDGKLVLTGREAIGSWFEQALVARRQTHFSYEAETTIDFSPTDERQFAGLTTYYSRYNFFYLVVSGDDDGNRELMIMSSQASWPDGKVEDLSDASKAVRLPKEGKVRLAMSVRGGRYLQFSYAMVGGNDQSSPPLQPVGPVLDATLVSDECGGHQAHGSFTGAFVGVACSDLNGLQAKASFESFVYRPVKDELDRYEV
jgi:xylan 1,4-beta-xylosidase